jgi:hypothetical protein
VTGQELLDLMPGQIIGFFTIDDKYPGIIKADRQKWIFEDDGYPRPITLAEIERRGGVEALADSAAELITPKTQKLLEGALAEHAKKNEFLNSIPLTKNETNAGDLQTKEKAT